MNMNETAFSEESLCKEDDSYAVGRPHIRTLRFWLQCILPLVIGLAGFIGNCLSVPVLSSKKLNSVFNRLLMFLAVFDNIFILCSILGVIRKNYDHSNLHIFVYAYFLYQMSAMSIVSSIWTTVMLALERYLVISKPTEYHIATQGINPWRRVLTYIVPVISFSIIFNIPKFFEIQISQISDMQKRQSFTNQNMSLYVNKTRLQLDPTTLRVNDDYILYYQNLAKLIVTGIIPFAALCFFNFRIYSALRRRATSGILSSGSGHQSSEDARNAILLFGIVFIFLLTNVWRIVINMYELIYIRTILQIMSLGCDPIPLWLHISADVSELLLVLNSSINFFLYCFMSSVFRDVLRETLCSLASPLVYKCQKSFKSSSSNAGRQGINEERLTMTALKNGGVKTIISCKDKVNSTLNIAISKDSVDKVTNLT